MKTLIIDCHKVKSQLKIANYLNWVKGFSDVTVKPDDLVNADFKADFYDAIILTGSEKFASKDEFNKGLFEFLRVVDRPLLGICYGHQLICKFLGCKVIYKSERVNGSVNVRIIDENELFTGFGGESLFDESHFDHVVFNWKLFDRLGLKLLATSDTCKVEAVKYLRRPLYGVQFHPERSGRNGRRVAENFYRYVVRR